MFVYLIETGLFEVKEGPLRVICEGIAIGQTIIAAYIYQFQLPPWKMVKAAITVNRERFEKTIETLLVSIQR